MSSVRPRDQMDEDIPEWALDVLYRLDRLQRAVGMAKGSAFDDSGLDVWDRIAGVSESEKAKAEIRKDRERRGDSTWQRLGPAGDADTNSEAAEFGAFESIAKQAENDRENRRNGHR